MSRVKLDLRAITVEHEDGLEGVLRVSTNGTNYLRAVSPFRKGITVRYAIKDEEIVPEDPIMPDGRETELTNQENRLYEDVLAHFTGGCISRVADKKVKLKLNKFNQMMDAWGQGEIEHLFRRTRRELYRAVKGEPPVEYYSYYKTCSFELMEI